jgi:hypothetical protein
VESTTGIFGGGPFIASSARSAKEIAQINRASALPPQ